MRPSLFRIALATLYLASFGVIGWLLLSGWSYYATPLGARAHHPGYWEWKPSGTVGGKLGVAGSTMIVALLLYSLRKRARAFRWMGSLPRWLDIHIYLGLVGPILVVLHSSFKVHGLVALSFWSMVAVTLSGILGRYLYLQIPRTRAGDEVSLSELEKQDRSLSSRLRSEFQLDEGLLSDLENLSAPGGDQGLGRAFVGILVGDLRHRAALRRFARACHSIPAEVLHEFRKVVRQKAMVHRRILLLSRVHELFHYWHVVHKPFAVVMYVFMAVHVIVAVATGYGRFGFR